MREYFKLCDSAVSSVQPNRRDHRAAVICFHCDRCIFCPYRTDVTITTNDTPKAQNLPRQLCQVLSGCGFIHGGCRLAVHHHHRQQQDPELAPKHLVTVYLLHKINLYVKEKQKRVYTMHFQTSNNNIWSAERKSFTFCLHYPFIQPKDAGEHLQRVFQ